MSTIFKTTNNVTSKKFNHFIQNLSMVVNSVIFNQTILRHKAHCKTVNSAVRTIEESAC